MNSSVHLEELYNFENQRTSFQTIEVLMRDLNMLLSLTNCITYLRSNEQIFENITFNIEKNSHTIITGPNGSGKSTLLGLISGLYIPNDGHINVSSKKPAMLESRH